MQQVLLLVTLFLISSSVHVDGQELFKREKRDYVWFFGAGDTQFPGSSRSVLTFSSRPPTVFSLEEGLPMNETNAIMCDDDGKLLFYTNGVTIVDSSHHVIMNGDSIIDGFFAEQAHQYPNDLGYVLNQGALFIPYPGIEENFILFHERREWGGYCSGIYYTMIRIEENSPVVVEKMEPIIEDTIALGGLTATRHANGRDWWIIIPKEDTNLYYTILVSMQGINLFEPQQVGRDINSGLCQNVFSPDGSKFIRFNAVSNELGSHIDIFEFNRCTGTLSNPRHISIFENVGPGGASISSNSRFLYITSKWHIFQYDLMASDIESSRETIGEYDGFFAPFSVSFFLSQLGPDNKIYINIGQHNTDRLSVISKPNIKGENCSLLQHYIDLLAPNSFSLPNFPYYGLGPIDGSLCDTLGIDNPIPEAAFNYLIEDSSTFKVSFYEGSTFSPDSWFWEFGDGQSSTERFPTHIYAAPGAYEVCLTASNQTGSDTVCDTVRFVVSGLLSVEGSGGEVRLFPNPASGVVTLSAQGLPAGVREAELALYDALGREVLRQGTAVVNGSVLHQLDLTHLPAGVYFWELRAASGEGLGVGRVVKR